MPDYLAFEDWTKALKKFTGFEDAGIGLALKSAKVDAEKDPKKAKALFEAVVAKADATKKKNASPTSKDGRAYIDLVIKEAKKQIALADERLRSGSQKPASTSNAQAAQGGSGKAGAAVLTLPKANSKLAPNSAAAESVSGGKLPVDTVLLAELKHSAKSPRKFVFVIGESVALVVSRAITPKHRETASAKSGGGRKFIVGKVTIEKGAAVFLLDKAPPAGLPSRLSKAIKLQTGKLMKVLVRGGGTEVDAAQDQGELNETQLTESPVATAAEQETEKVKAKENWDQAWQQAKQDVKPWSAYKGGATADLVQRMQAAQALAKADNYDEALAALDLVDEAISALEEQRNTWVTVQDDVANRLQQLSGEPNAEVARLAKAFGRAQEQGQQGLFQDAAAAATSIGAELAALFSETQPPLNDPEQNAPPLAESDEPELFATEADTESEADVPMIAFTQSRLRWDNARKQVQRDILSLQAALQKEALPDQADLAAGVGEILEQFDDSLLNTLDAALNAEDPAERRRHHREALQHIGTYLVVVSSDPLIPHVDANPWVPTKIQLTLSSTLTELANKLQA